MVRAAALPLIEAGSAWQRERWITLIRDLLEPREFARVGAEAPCQEQPCRCDKSNNRKESLETA